MVTTYFQGNKDHPQHISVGAVLMNDRSEVCCHHFRTKDLKGYWKDQSLDDFYLLMRETLEPDETLEHALDRGLMEEFGATAEMKDYIGSIQSRFKDNGIEVEKTTLYFLCKTVFQDASKRTGTDIEMNSLVEWQKPGFLIPRMKKQAEKYGRTDVDESGILEKLK
jgi:hypothetical protein